MAGARRAMERRAALDDGLPLLIAAGLIAAPSVARAQVGPPGLTPVPPLPAFKPPPPPRFEGTAQFGFVSTTGNSSTQSIGLAGETYYRPAAWVLQSKVNFVRLKSEGELKAKSLAVLFRAAREQTLRVAAYGQYDFLRDLFAGIEERHTATIGVAYKAIDAPHHRLTLRAGVGVAGERLVTEAPDDGGNGVSLDAREADVRATTTQTVHYVLDVSSTSQATNDLHLEESLGTARDWRLANEAAFATKINSIFSLKVSNTLRYVNDPVPGFERTDTITSISLVAKF